MKKEFDQRLSITNLQIEQEKKTTNKANKQRTVGFFFYRFHERHGLENLSHRHRHSSTMKLTYVRFLH